MSEVISPFAPAHRQMQQDAQSRPAPADLDDGLLIIARWISWLTYSDMMELAKDLMGTDYKPPQSPNEMAELLHRWQKAKISS